MYQARSIVMKLPALVALPRLWSLRHLIFWGATLVFFVVYFGRGASSYLQSVLFVCLLLPVAMATTYFLTAYLVPRYLLTGRYGRFALYSVYTLIGSVYLELIAVVASFIFLASYEIDAMSAATLDVFGLVVASHAVVFLAVAANLAVRWHRLNAEHAEVERARLEAELELRQAELARLKAQMQPHFLFNTLNNLYGLTLEGSNEAPEVVLRISQMLDYVLYGCERPLVPLAGEVEHLHAYLDLERLRYDDRVDIQLDVGPIPDAACITPLLLIPFVENSFKHGAARSTDASWVHIKLSASEEVLDFRVENGPRMPEHRSDDGRQALHGGDSRAAGIGLDNVRRRLGLLYPDTHELAIREAADRFTVRLRIPVHRSAQSEMPEAIA